MHTVTIYTTPTCGFCKQAKAYMADHNVSFEEKDVTVDNSARDTMLQKSRQMGVPVITVDDEVIIGFDRPKLAQALGISE